MSQVESNWQKGAALLKQGNISGAVEALEEATVTDPDSYEAFVYLGAAYSAQGQHNRAIGAFARASEIRPESSRVHFNLGQAYEAAGVPKKARKEYKSALQFDPNYTAAVEAMTQLSHRLPELTSPSIKIEESKS